VATSIEQIRSFLDEHKLRYVVDSARDTLLVGFRLDPEQTTYRDADGDPSLGLVIRVQEKGEFLSIFTPQAWSLEDCPNTAAVLEAVATIQGQYKLLRFDYDPDDGEIRPNVELPLEDATLTARQFHRLMHTMVDGVQRCDGVIREAMATGEVSLESLDTWQAHAGNDPNAADRVPDGSLAIDRLRSLADEAGGVEQLERLTGGDWPAEQPEVPAAQAEAVDPAPKPVIRRIWDRLFGRRASAEGGFPAEGGSSAEGEERKAG